MKASKECVLGRTAGWADLGGAKQRAASAYRRDWSGAPGAPRWRWWAAFGSGWSAPGAGGPDWAASAPRPPAPAGVRTSAFVRPGSTCWDHARPLALNGGASINSRTARCGATSRRRLAFGTDRFFSVPRQSSFLTSQAPIKMPTPKYSSSPGRKKTFLRSWISSLKNG